MTMRIFQFTLVSVLITSCNQKQPDTEYIKNLEEKNRILDSQLKERTIVIVPDTKEKLTSLNTRAGDINSPKNYFTIGSTIAEVIEVMGEPTGVMDFKEINRKILSFGVSKVTFEHGRVLEYSDYGKNLRVKYYEGKNEDVVKKVSNTKWVYFSGLILYNFDKAYCSKIYEINNYTKDKMLQIQNCLIDNLKRSVSGSSKVILNPNEFKSYSDASDSWRKEIGGKIFAEDFCNPIMSP